MRTALIHEWLVTQAGAESVLQSIRNVYPGDVFALFHDPDGLRGTLWEQVRVKTSMLQRIPLARKHHRAFLPLYPMAAEQFDLRDYNLVLSSSYAVAKGVLTSSDQLHICYCHSPMRYIWDLTFEYLQASGLSGGLKSFLVRSIFHYIRLWDAVSALRVNEFVANSHYIAHRIEKCYNRTATVIYPPVDVDQFCVSDRKDDYFVTVSRLVPYKRVDIAVEAFNRLGLPLHVIGEGPAKKQLKTLAKRNITFLGQLPSEELREHLSRARGFVFCAEEDFGIVNVEAQASGLPVIAFGRGGALETVVDGETGLFFYRQDVASLIEAVQEFLRKESSFDPARIRANAEQFPRSRFEREFKQFVDEAWEKFPYKKG
jgi:glycosyltransferase involved in cell wall biosynthesis